MLYDHVDLRVGDLAQARLLYDPLLSAMGYDDIQGDATAVGYYRHDADERTPYLWITEGREYRANTTRIAFAASSAAEVDRLAETARAAGARAFEPAQRIPEYCGSYFATFFEDADGNRLEIYFRSSA